METVYLIKAVLDGFLIGWGTCYLFCCARAWLKTAASAPRDALVRDDGAAEAVAGDSPARAPGAEPVKRPFADRDDNGGGHGTDNGDDDGFHAAILPQKQEAGK